MFDTGKSVDAVAVLPELAAAVAGLPPVQGGRSAIEAGVLIRASFELRRQLEAWQLSLIDSFHSQGHGEAWGSPSTAGFLAGFLQLDPAQGRSLVGAAKTARELPRLTSMVAAGKVGVEHLAAVTKHVKDLPSEALADADWRLWSAAGWGRPGDLRRIAAKIQDVWHADASAAHGRHLHESRYLHVVPTFGGAYSVEGMLEPEQGAVVLAALGSLTAPSGLEDTRTAAQRRADAFVELAQLGLRSGQLPDAGGDRPRVTIVVQPDTSARVVGTDVQLNQSALDRVCCDADLATLLLDGNGEVLNLGRTRRDPTPNQRRALTIRDGGCVFPNCGRPPAWCQAHHLRWWGRDQGRTDLNNLALVCSFHHHLIHDHTWLLERIPPGHQDRPPGHTGQAWQATSPEGLVLRQFRQQAA